MDLQASTSLDKFQIEDFLSIPWHLQKVIISELSPSDLLNFGRARPDLLQLALHHQKHWEIVENGDERLVVEKRSRAGRMQRRIWDYLGNCYHPMRMEEIRRKQSTPTYTVLFVENCKKQQEDDLDILIRNSKVKRMDYATLKHLNIGLQVDYLYQPDFASIEQLQELADRLKIVGLDVQATKVEALGKNGEFFRFFIDNPKITTANLYVFGQSHLHLIPKMQQTRQWMRICEHTSGIHEILFSVVEEIVQQWEANEREIDAWMVSLETRDDLGDDAFENILNFELNDMARKLAYGSLGNFNDRAIDERFRLIRRKDGTGLLIMTGASSISLFSCDYQYRRLRGLGFGKQIRAFFDELCAQIYELHFTEAQLWQAGQFGALRRKPPPAQEIIDQDVFSIFGELEPGAKADEKHQKGSVEVEDHGRVCQDQEMMDRRAVALQQIEELLKKHTAELGQVPERELAIDTLYLGGAAEPDLNRRLLNNIFYEGFEPSGFPSHYYFADWQTKMAYEFFQFYKKHGEVPKYYW
ncbi:unnamed protein product, partial [Mesorhabditis spiculigera]